MVPAVGLDGTQNLSWIGKTERVADICAPVNVLGPLDPTILIHATLLTQFMAQMRGSRDKGETVSIQGQWSRVCPSGHVAAHVQALGLAQPGVLVSTKADVVFPGELLTDLQHGCHCTASRSHQ